MAISSRTPEGSANHCPVCDAFVCIEPSQPPGDAPCPHCGSLLWFLPTSTGIRLYESEVVAPLRERIIDAIRGNLGVSKEEIFHALSFNEDFGRDSLDVVELVMELEEEFGFTIPDADTEKIKTVGDVIDYLVQRGLQ